MVKLTAGGDISLTGKEVVIEGSDLLLRKVFSGSNVVLVDGKLVPTAGISIIATDGSVELKGVKNSFSNYVSTHKIKAIEQQIIAVNKDLQEQTVKNGAVTRELNAQLQDLKSILETSKKASTGFEHKTTSLTAEKDINITSKQGVLIEGVDITSSKGGITVLAEGNLPKYTIDTTESDSPFPTIDLEELIDKGLGSTVFPIWGNRGNKTAQQLFNEGFNKVVDYKSSPLVSGFEPISVVQSKYNDSIRITGLADIYQQGSINNGIISGPNYSYHQLINQPKLTAKSDIKISGHGNLVKSSNKYDAKTKSYITNNNVTLNSADIQSTNGNVRIDAAIGDINLEASQVAFMDGSQTTSTSRKWYGKKKVTTTTKTSLNSNAITTDILANNINVNAEGNIKVYGSELVASPTGIIELTAGNCFIFISIDNIDENSIDIKKKSSFLGVRYNKDHTNDTRQELYSVASQAGRFKLNTESGGDTLLKELSLTPNKAKIQVGVGKICRSRCKSHTKC